MKDKLIRLSDALQAVRESYIWDSEISQRTLEKKLAALPEAEARPEWIPMSEEKPMFDGKYLCCWQGKTVDTGFFLNGHFRLYGENKDNLITAWMPLPAPYKEEE